MTRARATAARADRNAPRLVGAAALANGTAAANGEAAAYAGKMPRIVGLDALRGVAIVAMAAYHFCFDLRYFGITRSDFEHDPRWLIVRTLILSSFLLIAGISAVLAQRRTLPAARSLRRIAVIAGAALLVSAGSWLMFPRSFIWFGVLHAIALSLLLARPLLGRPWVAATVGIAVIVAGATLDHPAFDGRALGWIGFMTTKPVTEDYVPLFPWAGVLFLGIAAGHALLRTRFAVLGPLARLPTPLRWLGRHSLIVYLVHQPAMIALLWLVLRAQ
jgi:uncharacterized membrane protein